MDSEDPKILLYKSIAIDMEQRNKELLDSVRSTEADNDRVSKLYNRLKISYDKQDNKMKALEAKAKRELDRALLEIQETKKSLNLYTNLINSITKIAMKRYYEDILFLLEETGIIEESN